MGASSSKRVAPLPAAEHWKQHAAGSYPARFVELAPPEEEDDIEGNGFLFVESCCYNKVFDSEHFYVPVQHTDNSCHIYQVSTTLGNRAVHLCQVKKKSDGETALSPFGSALSDEGMLWLCCFNESLVCAINLKSETYEMVAEAKVPAPNDCCLSEDGKFVYAGCGSWLGSVPLAAGAGTVWRVETTHPYKVKKVVGWAHGTMAGIAEARGKLFCAHLQRMSVYGSRRAFVVGKRLRKQIWTALCSQDEDAEKTGKYYLADNLTWWDTASNKGLLTPCYRYVSSYIGYLLDRSTTVNAFGWSLARAATTLLRLKEGGFEALARVNDDVLSPEVDLSFSKGDVFEHVHLCLYNTETGATANHVFLLDEKVQGYNFDGHVTHAEHVGNGRVACINFIKRKALIIDTTGLVELP